MAEAKVKEGPKGKKTKEKAPPSNDNWAKLSRALEGAANELTGATHTETDKGTFIMLPVSQARALATRLGLIAKVLK